MRRLLLPLALTACAEPESPPFDDLRPGTEEEGTVRFDVHGGFWDAPFPSDHRVRRDTRRVDVSGFPNPEGNALVTQLVGLLDDQVQGWSLSGAMQIPVAWPVDPSTLPDLEGSVQQDASVFLMDVHPDSPDVGTRWPIDVVARSAPGSPYGPEHAIAALPLQGVYLAPRRRYALVVTADVHDVDGFTLGPPPAVRDLVAGRRPEGWRRDVAAQYLDAVEVLAASGVDVERIVGLSVFTTGRPTADLVRLFHQASEIGGMQVARSPKLLETHDDYCVYEGEVTVPVYQTGTPPYATEGGTFERDARGDFVLQDQRVRARLFVTLPRKGNVPERYPTVVFARTGGGGDRPLLDRGPRDENGDSEPASGYAGVFARAGWAAVQIDGPLGGPLRNPSGADEQFLIFNVANPGGMRDTLRQTALELALVPEVLDAVFLPAGSCPGVPVTPGQPWLRLSREEVVLFGHSMGATVAPVAAALEPAFDALILSGAGGSWIENVLHKRSPLEVAPLASAMVGEDVPLDAMHPVLSLLQWAGEPADPPVYAPRLRGFEPERAPHVLMFQGVVDTYIPPPVANALSLSLGLDLGGASLDAEVQPEHRSLASLLPFSGGKIVPLPSPPNQAVAEDSDRVVTRLVVQHREDGIEDGHEVAYQLPLPRHQVSCLLRALRQGKETWIPGSGEEGDPCPTGP